MPVLSLVTPFDGERDLKFALAVLTVLDMEQIRQHRLPPLYASGVRYRREQPKQCWAPVNGGCEDWLTALELLRQGVGDCEDLAAYRAAELRLAGEKATAFPRPNGVMGWHIQVRREDGSIEDPSAKLGMPTGRTKRP